MTIQYSITENDIVDFNVFHLLDNPVVRKREKLRRFLIPGWVVMLYVFFVLKHYPVNKFAPLFFSPFLIFAVIWFLSYHMMYRFNVTRKVRAIIAKNPENGLLGSYTIKTGKKDMTITTNGGQVKYAFSDIIKVKKTETFLYLFRDENTAIAIPKTSFESKSEEETFLGFFK